MHRPVCIAKTTGGLYACMNKSDCNAPRLFSSGHAWTQHLHDMQTHCTAGKLVYALELADDACQLHTGTRLPRR